MPDSPFADARAATEAHLANASGNAPQAPNPQQAPIPQDFKPTGMVDPTQTQPAPDQAPDNAQAPTPLTWESIDLSALPEDQQKFIQDGYLRQSDYTRKTQELADQRRQFEQFGDMETIQEAVQLAQALNDPQQIRQLYENIGNYLQTEGSNPGSQQATDQNVTGLDHATQSRIDAMESYISEMQNQSTEMQLVQQQAERFQTAENAIRETYPSYSDDDIKHIYDELPAADFDLFKAQERFESLRGYFEKSMLGKKADFPDAANNVRSGGGYTPPNQAPDFKWAKEASLARLNAAE